MSTSIPQGLPKIDLIPTIGMDFIGLLFAAVFHGITTLQAIFYYRTYTKDRVTLKILVAVLWILDTLSVALIANGVYTYLVLDFADPLAVEALVWSINSEPAVTALIALIVQLFLVYRIRTLNQAWTPFCVILALISLLPFSLGIVAVYTIDAGSQSLAAVGELHWLAIAADVSSSVIDLTIAASICWLLYKGRNGFSQTERIINSLTLYVITSGLTTASLTTGTMISYLVAPTTLVFQMINMSVSKAYVNTFLATLNSRQSIRGYPSTADTSKFGYGNEYVLPFRAASGTQISQPNTRVPRTVGSSVGGKISESEDGLGV
ncbi:hypothetical protein BV22DRAFT_1135390 [Leucogyrophana mollusca]|uniref:Uncharacterized protein n=1 Tax=Leucogyrophana mollusca TaxID=85980 RepID=A0ACB8AW00_9AGAM|nr:hypothetical protein BV22DRAFT_1135390 [Leucogyrophana mollusca]